MEGLRKRYNSLKNWCLPRCSCHHLLLFSLLFLLPLLLLLLLPSPSFSLLFFFLKRLVSDNFKCPTTGHAMACPACPCPTPLRTNQPTDRQTDTASYRGALAHLKKRGGANWREGAKWKKYGTCIQ